MQSARPPECCNVILNQQSQSQSKPQLMAYYAEVDELHSAITNYTKSALTNAKLSMPIREVELSSLSVCSIKTVDATDQSLIIKPDENNGGSWSEVSANEAGTSSYNHSIVPYVALGEGETIRIP